MPKKTSKMLVDEALAQIETLSPEQALEAQANGSAILVDIRDVRELQREGKLADAVHAPRGMLEFWFDPESPYHRDVFADPDKKYVFFCAAGWRSALAAKSINDMGFDNIAHIDGGFGRIKQTDGAKIIEPEAKKGE